jgi:hypothetical protein
VRRSCYDFRSFVYVSKSGSTAHPDPLFLLASPYRSISSLKVGNHRCSDSEIIKQVTNMGISLRPSRRLFFSFFFSDCINDQDVLLNNLQTMIFISLLQANTKPIYSRDKGNTQSDIVSPPPSPGPCSYDTALSAAVNMKQQKTSFLLLGLPWVLQSRSHQKPVQPRTTCLGSKYPGALSPTRVWSTRF